MTVVSFLRNMAFLALGAKGSTERVTIYDIVIFVVVCIVTAVFAFFTYAGAFSLLPIVGTLMYSFSICQKNILLYRRIGIFSTLVWFTYNIYVFNVVGILGQATLFFFIIHSYKKLRNEEMGEGK